MFVSTDITGPLSANMYAYCENNPVNASDPNGEKSNELAKFCTFVLFAGALTLALAATGPGALLLASAGVTMGALAETVGAVEAITISVSILYASSNKSEKKPTSQNQMQKQVEKGQAPKEVDRVDPAHTTDTNAQPHIHFKDGSALNIDGTIKEGVVKIVSRVAKWIVDNNWVLPKL